jgi:hypothetical protein
MPDACGMGGRDSVGRLVGSDTLGQKEQLLDAGKGGPKRRRHGKIADRPLDPFWKSARPDRIADEDTQSDVMRIELVNESRTDVSGSASDQYHCLGPDSFAV